MTRFNTGLIETNRTGNGSPTPTEGEQSGRQRTGAISSGTIFGGSSFDGATTGLGYSGARSVPEDALARAARAGGIYSGSPFWGMIFGASYPTYRLMRCHPTVAIVRAIVRAPLISTQWMIERREGVTILDEWGNYFKREILPMRRRMYRNTLRALDYGWAGFERIWEYREGFWICPRFKALAPDYNRILIDKKANFAGLRPADGAGNGDNDLVDWKVWKWTYDQEADAHYGRSRNENIRETSWANWLDTVLKNERLKAKLAGILPIFYHPPGGFEDPPQSGKYVSYQDACRTAAALKQGEYVTIERMPIDRLDIQKNPDLLKAADVMIDFYDAGNAAPGQEANIHELEYHDKGICRGWLRPERMLLEAASGTRADAEAHTTTGIEDGEDLCDEIDEDFNREHVDRIMALNFGEQARGALRVKTAPLVNRKAAVYSAVLQVIAKAGQARAFARMLDWLRIFEGLDFPVVEGAKFEPEASPKTGGKPGASNNPDDPNNPDNQDDEGDGAP